MSNNKGNGSNNGPTQLGYIKQSYQIPSSALTSSAYDGISVKNMYTNPLSKRVILYNSNEAAYDNLLSCTTGVSNIDNICLCPGSLNSPPFNVEPNMMSKLFTPEVGIPPPTHSSRCLMAARRPLHPSAGYESYLGSCSK